MTIAMEDLPVNVWNPRSIQAFASIVEETRARPGLRGIVLRSGRETFLAGADLTALKPQGDVERNMAPVRELRAALRRLETCGVPVVAAIDGHALGGCHRRGRHALERGVAQRRFAVARALIIRLRLEARVSLDPAPIADAMARGAEDAMPAVAETLRTFVDDCFEQQRDPWGTPCRVQAVATLQEAIAPHRSGTYRKAKPGNWREHFTEANIAVFKKHAGDLLIDLGYETSEDW